VRLDLLVLRAPAISIENSEQLAALARLGSSSDSQLRPTMAKSVVISSQSIMVFTSLEHLWARRAHVLGIATTMPTNIFVNQQRLQVYYAVEEAESPFKNVGFSW
jgi:hypothetical protein